MTALRWALPFFAIAVAIYLGWADGRRDADEEKDQAIASPETSSDDS